ncbi:helix-turn-helix domain-containing protein [Verticiella sediminum]|uniref:Helix-turn-helix domain-containing protein n=1 Tax=Verticiella sediminum TaxID=1247510 RepID=A0A556AYC2_9BURK|nr:helix-turn-helix domain-containing protein [Verticiella sediminum]TSH97940.1 helix-turn-helix domain-containing protein [Verticiella sediminum]
MEIATVPADTEAESRLVGALARGVAVMRAFTPTRTALSVKELAQATGLPKPTLARLLDTLCELGLLRYSERLSRYVPGLGMLTLGAPVLARMTIRQLARPLMQELADHVRGQVALVAADRHELTYVEIVHGADSVLFRPEIGGRISVARTASGRAYLCSLSEPERRHYVEQVLHDPDGARRPWLAQRLQAAERSLAEHGMCLSHGDLHREIETVAVPFPTRVDGEFWVLATSVGKFNLRGDEIFSDIGPRAVTLVRTVEAALGGG